MSAVVGTHTHVPTADDRLLADGPADLTDVGMIFVRCGGGVSHNPDETITEADAAAGASLLLRVIENFQTEG